MISLQTNVGQLSATGGVCQSWAPNARAVEPTVSDRLGQRKGNLYVLTELLGSQPSPQVLYRQIVNVIQRVYYEAPSSVTAALQSAIVEAHLLLQEAGVTGGVSCVVLRDAEIYIAQVVPALVVVAHPTIVQLFPASPMAFENPLGGRTRPEIGLFHSPVEIPTAILLANSRWLSRVEPRMLAGAMTASSVSGILDVLREFAGRASLSAMVVGLGMPADAPEVRDGREVEAWVEEVRGEVEEEDVYQTERDWEESPGERAESARSVGDMARDAGRGIATIGSRLADSAKTLGERMLPDAEAKMRKRARPRERPERKRSRWPVIVAVAMPLLVALVAAALWWQRGWERDQQFTSMLQGARAALDGTVGMEDEALARGQLRDAEGRITEALLIRPGDPDAESLRQEIQRELDRVNHVVTLPMLMPLQQYSGMGRDLGGVLLSGRNVFVLDRGKDEVYQYQLDPDLHDVVEPVGEGPVIRKGQQAGQAVVSELADMSWLTAVGNQDKSGLLVLDQAGGLFLSDATGMWQPIHLPLQLPKDWRYPQSAETYQGNFYVLEPTLHQIFRYVPSGGGYGESPTGYFEDNALINLGGVVDMAISSELCGGHVYLLYRNGILTKYTWGSPEPFEADVLDQRLQDTPAFFSSADECHLYVADAGNNRIVEFDANGIFQHQYRLAEGDTLRSVRSLFVDEADGAFYILTDDALYRTPIPR